MATIVLAVWLAITAIVPMSGVLARDGAPPPAMIPIQMSFHGDNLDIVTGILAIAVGLVLARRPLPRLELAFQIVGLALLVRVASIAVMSAPGPMRAYDGMLLQLPFHAPYAWIVSVCVAGALAGHVIGLRAVVRRLRAAR